MQKEKEEKASKTFAKHESKQEWKSFLIMNCGILYSSFNI